MKFKHLSQPFLLDRVKGLSNIALSHTEITLPPLTVSTHHSMNKEVVKSFTALLSRTSLLSPHQAILLEVMIHWF